MQQRVHWMYSTQLAPCGNDVGLSAGMCPQPAQYIASPSATTITNDKSSGADYVAAYKISAGQASPSWSVAAAFCSTSTLCNTKLWSQIFGGTAVRPEQSRDVCMVISGEASTCTCIPR